MAFKVTSNSGQSMITKNSNSIKTEHPYYTLEYEVSSGSYVSLGAQKHRWKSK